MYSPHRILCKTTMFRISILVILSLTLLSACNAKHPEKESAPSMKSGVTLPTKKPPQATRNSATMPSQSPNTQSALPVQATKQDLQSMSVLDLDKAAALAVLSKDYPTALQDYYMAVARGDTKAEYEIGTMYSNGKGVPYDINQAVIWWTKAANVGNADAAYQLGTIYELGGYGSNGLEIKVDNALAAMWYLKGAQNGSAEAQFAIGRFYYTGRGVSQDFAQAAHWFSLAVKQGDALGMYGLGVSYWKGNGVKQDDTTAYGLFKSAAEQGIYGAQLGLFYVDKGGTGVDKDDLEAYKWCTIAFDLGNKFRADAIGAYPPLFNEDETRNECQELSNHLTADQATQAQQQIAAWESAHEQLMSKREP